MKTIFPIATFILCLVFCGKASASPSGTELQSKCKTALKDQADAFDGGYCAGFIDGVMSQTLVEAKAGFDVPFCLPTGGSMGQIVQVFVKYLDDHPERLHEPASLLLVESLAKAFPCHK